MGRPENSDFEEIEPKSSLFDIGQGYKIDPNDIMVPTIGPDKFKFTKLIFVKTDDNQGIFYFSDGATLADGLFGVKIHDRQEFAQLTIKNGKVSSVLNPQQILIGEGSVDDDIVLLQL